MKTIISTLILSVAVLSASAQSCVVNAYNALKGQELEKASNYIEECMDNDKATSKDKTWRYRGQIYMAISQNPDLKGKYPDALQKATDSFLKAKELDEKGSYTQENDRGLQVLQIVSLNSGVEDYNNKNYKEAVDKFQISKKISDHYGKVDSLAIYNIGLSQERAGNIDAAIDSYMQCAEIGFNTPDVYLFVANLYKNKGQEDKAIEILRTARESYPREQSLIIEELNIQLANENYEEALNNLRLAAEQDPTNEILFFSMGSVSDNLGNFEEAETSYKKAIEINPNYFDANYNLGAMYYNQAVEKNNTCNEIPPKEQKKYEACKVESEKIFAKATPYLERALEVQPEDESTMQSLKNVYARTGQDAKYKEMKKMLGEE